ncbi:hypothetical protein [Nocardia sp. NPDC049526]|uniref:ATP dependent DNA ligase n=1 Tax=Nocardia sp. NPDC049526 TaxID=3364316 RepID=UPI0037AFCE6D
MSSLLMAVHDSSGKLAYIGNVGTSFTQRMLDELRAELQPLQRKTPTVDANILICRRADRRARVSIRSPRSSSRTGIGGRAQRGCCRASRVVRRCRTRRHAGDRNRLCRW